MAYRGSSAELVNELATGGAIPASLENNRPVARQDVAPVAVNPRMMELIAETAAVLQIPAHELATQISYETGGTMNPMQPGPVTQWGRHRGLIQFGEPQAAEYGVDFSSPEAALESQLGKDGAIVRYALGRGFKPGEHNGLNLYATINAGNPYATGATDENNGGAPGTVAEKYYNQMAAHAAKFSDIPWDAPAFGKKSAPTEERTAKQKQLDGWQYFVESMGQSNDARPVAPLNTGGGGQQVPMMAIPEF